jgi:hypothetical protein
MKPNTCLICGTSPDVAAATLEPELVAHHTAPAAQENAERASEKRWVCNGSGFPPAEGGDIDVTRRRAIKKHRIYASQAAALKRKLVAALGSDNWHAADAIQFFGDVAALNEEIAQYWSRAARTTSLLEVVRTALSDLAPHTRSNAPLGRVFEEIHAQAARQFMVEVRREVERTYPDGLNADQTATILFDI